MNPEKSRPLGGFFSFFWVRSQEVNDEGDTDNAGNHIRRWLGDLDTQDSDEWYQYQSRGMVMAPERIRESMEEIFGF